MDANESLGLALGGVCNIRTHVIATVAVEAVPHRGIAFVQEIRYALTTSPCGISAVGAAILYGFLKERVSRPRSILCAFVLGFALIILGLMGIVGEPGLLRAAIPAVFSIAIVLSLLVPYFSEHPLRRVGKVITLTFGGLWITEAATGIVASGGKRMFIGHPAVGFFRRKRFAPCSLLAILLAAPSFSDLL